VSKAGWSERLDGPASSIEYHCLTGNLPFSEHKIALPPRTFRAPDSAQPQRIGNDWNE
jgi:hypothetical protein